MKNKTVFRIFILTILLTFGVVSIISAIKISNNFPALTAQYCDSIIVTKMSEVINQTLAESIKKYDTENIIKISRNADGKIDMITVDSARVNQIKSELTIIIIDKIKEMEDFDFEIPLGNALGSYFLSGYGPKIPLKAVPVGSVISKTESSFVSGGINQTKYELYVEFILCIKVTGPFSAETREVKGKLCIAETIIVGESNGIIWGSNQ